MYNEETVKKKTNKNVLIGCLGLIVVIIVVLVILTADIYQKSSAINVYQCFLGICS